MRRIGTIVLLTLLALVVLNRPTQAQADPKAEILRLVNVVRARNGLAPYTYNAQLAAAAQQQSNYMAEFNVYVHSGYGGSTPLSRAQAQGYSGFVSENVVGGTNLSPRAGVLWWENSPIHLRGMTSSNYTEAGVGLAQGYDQNFYTLVMGRRATSNAGSSSRIVDVQPEPLRITPITLAAPREDGSIVHVAQTGQAMWTIAAYYDVELDFLLSINNMSESDWLIDGQAVMVRPPDDWIPPPTPTPSPTHIVQKGENLWYITSLYNIEMSDLLWLNGLTLDSLIRPGRELKVRLLPGEAPPPTPTPQLAHIVSSGDTLWSIALSYGLSLEELLAFNGLTADALLQLGDALLIRPNPTPTPMPTPVTVPTDAAPVVDLIDAVPVAEVIDVQQTLTPVVQQFSMEAQPIPTDVVDSAETDANPTNFGFILLAAAFVLLAGGALTLAMRGS